MSDYIGGGLTLLLIVAAIVAVLFAGSNGGTGDASIIPEAVAAAPAGNDYGWKGATPQFDDRGEVAEFY